MHGLSRNWPAAEIASFAIGDVYWVYGRLDVMPVGEYGAPAISQRDPYGLPPVASRRFAAECFDVQWESRELVDALKFLLVELHRRAALKFEIASREIDSIIRGRPRKRELRHSVMPSLYLSGAGGKARSRLEEAGIEIQRGNHLRGLLAWLIHTQCADQGHLMAQTPCVNAEV